MSMFIGVLVSVIIGIAMTSIIIGVSRGYDESLIEETINEDWTSSSVY